MINMIKTIAGIGLALAMVVLVGYGLYRAASADKILPQVKTGLLDQYAKLVSEEKYSDAYEKFTSAEFRKQYTIENFTEAQKSNRQKYGSPVTIISETNIITESMEPGRKTYYRMPLKYSGSSDFVYISIDTVKEGDLYKIDKTYERSTRSDTMKEKIF